MLWILTAVVVLGLVATTAWSWRRPADLGLVDGRLRPCQASPNCVCSQDSTESHAIEPLHFEGAAEAAFARLRQTLAELPRTRIVTNADGYIHAEVTTALLRFVDDVECSLDRDAGVIHMRSASRVGHSDMGANRARVEDIRRRFAGSD